jgi:hypothetical protein
MLPETHTHYSEPITHRSTHAHTHIHHRSTHTLTHIHHRSTHAHTHIHHRITHAHTHTSKKHAHTHTYIKETHTHIHQRSTTLLSGCLLLKVTGSCLTPSTNRSKSDIFIKSPSCLRLPLICARALLYLSTLSVL